MVFCPPTQLSFHKENNPLWTFFSGKISWVVGSTNKRTRKRDCEREGSGNASEKQTSSEDYKGVDTGQCIPGPPAKTDHCGRNNARTEGGCLRAF